MTVGAAEVVRVYIYMYILIFMLINTQYTAPDTPVKTRAHGQIILKIPKPQLPLHPILVLSFRDILTGLYPKIGPRIPTERTNIAHRR